MNTRSHFSRHPQRGLSLIEVLIALMLGVFLLGGVIQIFIINRQTYRTQENLARLQEDGRFALDLLNRYVRLAGYLSSETVYSTRYYDQKCEDRIDNVFGQRVYYKGSVPTMPPPRILPWPRPAWPSPDPWLAAADGRGGSGIGVLAPSCHTSCVSMAQCRMANASASLSSLGL